MVPSQIVFIGVVLVVIGSVWMIVAARPIGARAVRTFALRQELRLHEVVYNREVSHYLTTTRAWRVGGLVVATIFAFGTSVRVEFLIAAFAAQHVLLRPPGTSTQAVDHALRSRSLHALSAAVTAGMTLGVAALVMISPRLNPAGSTMLPLSIILCGAIGGWLIRRARRPLPW